MNTKTIVCIGGRCSTWGKNWKKHIYNGGEGCLRCGMSRKEQWEEDKFAGLVTGPYKPNTGKPRESRPVTSKQVMYCALSEYGIEYAAPTRKQCQAFIDESDADDDYYSIIKQTKAELAAMPEV